MSSPKIVWKKRFNGDIGNRCLVCVDGIHFKIDEPRPFSSRWNSHKLGGSALAYELVSNIMTGDIVAFNGPFPAGEWPDLKIFRNKTRQRLTPGEKVQYLETLATKVTEELSLRLMLETHYTHMEWHVLETVTKP